MWKTGENMRIWRALLLVFILLLLAGTCAAEEPVLFTGSAVTVNGAELSDCVRIKKIDCVDLEEFCLALDATWVWTEEKGGLLWDGEWITLRERIGGFFFGETWCKLPIGPVVAGDHVYVPLEALCEGLGIGYFYDTDRFHAYATPAAGQWQIPTGYRVPTLMYHGVSDTGWGAMDLFVRPADLEAQLQYLTENGYTPIWFEDLARVDEIEKPVLLTFDDGYVDNYTELFPLLQKYDVKATIFVIAGTVDWNPNNLTSAQIKEMSDSCLVSIQSHTQTHPYLPGLDRETQEWELEYSKLVLTRITGKEPYVICYPAGNVNADTLELAERHYRMGVDMGNYWYTTGDDPYLVRRWYVSRYLTLGAFAQLV